MLNVVLALSFAANPTVVTLSNGMRWVLAPSSNEPRVGGVVVVRVGGAHERAGEAGVAHLLEHLAFKGTPVTGPFIEWRLEHEALDEVLRLTERYDTLVAERGEQSKEAIELLMELTVAEGKWEAQAIPWAFVALMNKHDLRFNAQTSFDRTRYVGDFPPSQLELWLTAQAEQFAAPVFRQFRAERDVVLQERFDSESPFTDAMATLYQGALGDDRPWSLIGSPEDIRRISPSTVDAFYARHYAPSNAVGALVGNFDPVQAEQTLRRTFERIPDRSTAPMPIPPLGPPKHQVVKGRERGVLLAFPQPGLFDSRSLANRVALAALTQEGGALFELCAANKPCTRLTLSRGPATWSDHLLVLAMTPSATASPKQLLDEALSRLERAAPSEAQLRAAWKEVQLDAAHERSTRAMRAAVLAESLINGAPLDDVFLERVTPPSSPAEVRKALARFRRDQASTIVQGGP